MAASQSAAPVEAVRVPEPKFIWYTIRRGDTAARIARNMLDRGQSGDIVNNNPEIRDWRKLQTDMRVRLPIKKLKEKEKNTLPKDFTDPIYADNPPPPPPRPEEELKHPYP